MIMRGVAVCVRNIIGDYSEGRRGKVQCECMVIREQGPRLNLRQ